MCSVARDALQEVASDGTAPASDRVRACELLLDAEPQVVRLEPQIEELLVRLLGRMEDMAAEQSQEITDMNDAIARLNAELEGVAAVDAEIQSDLVVLPELLERIQPTSPEQVNAVAAVASQLHSLTAKLKEAAAPAEEAEQAAQASASGGGDGSGQPQAAAPTVSGISPSSGPTGGGGEATISGADLDGASVTFAGNTASVVSSSPTTLSVTVPAGTAGEAEVVVTTPVGSASTQYDYEG